MHGPFIQHSNLYNLSQCLEQMGLKNTLKKREGEITYDIPFMWNLKRNDTNELTNRKRLTDLEKELMVCSEGV